MDGRSGHGGSRGQWQGTYKAEDVSALSFWGQDLQSPLQAVDAEDLEARYLRLACVVDLLGRHQELARSSLAGGDRLLGHPAHLADGAVRAASTSG
jgi:hypothetical protein